MVSEINGLQEFAGPGWLKPSVNMLIYLLQMWLSLNCHNM